MKISIIIPAYNVADYITTCLDSIEFSSIKKLRLLLLMMDQVIRQLGWLKIINKVIH